MSDVRNVIIIGSGPAGYTAAIYAARANLKPLVFEGSVTAGGALMNTTDVENFPGFPDGVMGPDLMDNLRKQAERFGAELVTDDVTEVDLTGDVEGRRRHGDEHLPRPAVDPRHRLGATASWACRTRSGCPATASPGAPPVTASSSATRTSPSSAAATPRWRRPPSSPGSPASVTIVHRRDALRASKIMQDRAFANEKIHFVWDSEVADVLGDDRGRRRAAPQRADRRGDARSTSPACSSRSATTRAASSSTARSTSTTRATSWSTRRRTETNLAGVFACGDVVDHTYRQAITAAGTGCAAALDAERWPSWSASAAR